MQFSRITSCHILGHIEHTFILGSLSLCASLTRMLNEQDLNHLVNAAVNACKKAEAEGVDAAEVRGGHVN